MEEKLNLGDTAIGGFRRCDKDNEEHSMRAEFIRHFTMEGFKLLREAEGITMFREYHVADKALIFTQGMMIAIAAMIGPMVELSVSTGHSTGNVDELIVDFMAKNARAGMLNAKEVMKEIEKLRR